MVQTVDADGWRISEHHIRTLAVNILAEDQEDEK